MTSGPPRPTHCVGPCGRELVRTPAERLDPKKQAVHYGKGLCNACVYIEKRGKTPRKRGEREPFCWRCKRPTRAQTQPPDGVTVPYAGQGLCKNCWMVVDRALDVLLRKWGWRDGIGWIDRERNAYAD